MASNPEGARVEGKVVTVRAAVRICISGAAAAFMLMTAIPALAAPPENDSIEEAISVDSVPFVHEQDTTDATASGPGACGNNSSVFFRFEPTTTGRYQVDTIGSEYDTVVTVFTGRGSSIDLLGCNDDLFGLASGLRFRGEVETSYYIMVSTCCGSGQDGIGGPLMLSVDRVDPAPLSAAIDITGGSTDPISGDLTVTGTSRCSERSVVFIEAVVRQVRDSLFVARVYVSLGLACAPGLSGRWSAVLEPQTGVVFGTGQASVRYDSRGASDGFRDQVTLPAGEATIVVS